MKTITVEVPESIAITVKNHGEQQLDLSKMSPEWLAWAITNGVRQSVGDADAGKAGTDEGNKAIWDKWSRIAEGNIPAGGGGGGARVDAETRHLREIIVKMLQGIGKTKADAGKAVKKDLEAAFREVLSYGLTKKYGKDGATSDRLEEAFTVNWPNIQAKAKAAAEEERKREEELLKGMDL